MVNFRQPFLANRLQDFWRRWHISLSTWLRDYLYIPLGGSAGGQWKTTRNLFVTMVLAGLWHGANWTFVIFGAIHGVVLAVERYFFPVKAKSQSATLPALSTGSFSLSAQRILTFHVLGLSLAFFRATSLTSAVLLLAGLCHFVWRRECSAGFFILFSFTTSFLLVHLFVVR